jgi:hypothetical protein
MKVLGFLILFIMFKIITFLNKHSILINSVFIAFWVYIIFTNYQNTSENGTAFPNKSFYIALVFVLLSIFNIYMAVKRKNNTNR